jgi:hypothetical protein
LRYPEVIDRNALCQAVKLSVIELVRLTNSSNLNAPSVIREACLGMYPIGWTRRDKHHVLESVAPFRKLPHHSNVASFTLPQRALQSNSDREEPLVLFEHICIASTMDLKVDAGKVVELLPFTGLREVPDVVVESLNRPAFD